MSTTLGVKTPETILGINQKYLHPTQEPQGGTELTAAELREYSGDTILDLESTNNVELLTHLKHIIQIKQGKTDTDTIIQNGNTHKTKNIHSQKNTTAAIWKNRI